MSKEEYISIFNAVIIGTPVSFTDKLLPLISDYLTEINYENLEKTISLIMQNPQLIERFMPDIVDHYCRKYSIYKLQKLPGRQDINIIKTILYYG